MKLYPCGLRQAHHDLLKLKMASLCCGSLVRITGMDILSSRTKIRTMERHGNCPLYSVSLPSLRQVTARNRSLSSGMGSTGQVFTSVSSGATACGSLHE